MADSMPSINMASNMSSSDSGSASSSGNSGDGGVFAGVLGQTMASDNTPSSGNESAPESAPSQPAEKTAPATAGKGATKVKTADAQIQTDETDTLENTEEPESATPATTLTAMLESKLQTPLNLSTKGTQATAEGNQTAVQALAAQLADIQQKLQQQGVNLDTLSQSTDNLKQALVALGMNESDAATAAQDIQNSLNTTTQTLNLDSASQNAMALMLVASAAGAAGVQQPLPAITVKTPAPTPTPTKTTAANSVFKGLNQTSASQLARTVAGVETPPTPEATPTPEPQITIRDGKVETSNASSTENLGFAPENTTVRLAAAPENTPPAPGNTAAAQAATAVNQAVSIPTQLTTSMAAGAERIAPQTTKVAEGQSISKPSGETLYKWKPAETGVETLEATPAVGDTTAATLTANPSIFGQQANPLDPTATGNLGHGKFESYLSQAQNNASVAQQTVVQFQGLAQDGGGTVRLKLHPEQMGEVTIELKVTGGEVSGSISATQAQAVHELARDLHQLKQSLADAGLKLGNEGINLMLSNSGQNGTGQNNSQNGQMGSGWGGGTGEGGAAGNAETTAETWDDTPYWVAADKVLDVRV